LNAAAEAKAAGYGGIAAASRVTKLARSTIGRGLKDLRDPGSLGRKVRRKGGGSPRLTMKDPTLLADLELQSVLSAKELRCAGASGRI
jgi:hypothetical protein